jgi:hypothetical protein
MACFFVWFFRGAGRGKWMIRVEVCVLVRVREVLGGGCHMRGWCWGVLGGSPRSE